MRAALSSTVSPHGPASRPFPLTTRTLRSEPGSRSNSRTINWPVLAVERQWTWRRGSPRRYSRTP